MTADGKTEAGSSGISLLGRAASATTFTLLGLAAAGALIINVLLCWVGFVDAPFGDTWQVLPDIAGLDNLFQPHNEHPIAVGRVALWLDWHLGEGRGRLAQLLTIAMIASLLPVYAWLASRSGFGRPLLVVVPVALALLFAPNDYHNLVWYFQVTFVPSYVLTVVALAAFAAYAIDNSRVMLVAAFIAAILSSVSLVQGVFAPTLLAFMAVTLRKSWIAIVFAAMATVFWIWIVALPSSTVSVSGASAAGLISIGSIVHFFLIYLGAAAAPAGLGAATALGVLMATLSGAALLHIALRRRNDPIFVALGCTILFSLMTGGAIAIGRGFMAHGLGYEIAATSRYFLMVAILSVTVFIVIMDIVKFFPLRARWTLALMSPFPAALLLISTLAGLSIFQRQTEEHRLLLPASTAIVAGVDDTEAVIRIAGFLFVAGDQDMMRTGADLLRRTQKSIFADPVARRMGDMLTSQEAGSPACDDAIWTADTLGPNARFLRAKGQFARTAGTAGAMHVLITAPSGEIVGYGRVPRRASDFNPFAQDDGRQVDWLGHVRPGASSPLTAWLFTADTVRCSLGSNSPL